MPRHRHQEWIKFLKLIDEQTPADRELHLIVDNYSTHKHPKVQKWLKRHPLSARLLNPIREDFSLRMTDFLTIIKEVLTWRL
jgi:hypothetical protein